MSTSRIILVLLALLVAGCASPQAVLAPKSGDLLSVARDRYERDEIIRSGLVGSWMQEATDPHQLDGIMSFARDGSGISLVWPKAAPSQLYRIDFTWSVLGGRLTSKPQRVTPKVPLDLPTKFVDTVEFLGVGELVVRFTEGYDEKNGTRKRLLRRN